MPKVAIACQGGGSHAAFAAGVLQRLLAADLRSRYELLGLSGTSGGAMCAALAWSGLLCGGPDEAIRRLGAFWDDLKAREPADAITNFWGVWAARLPVTLEISPYQYAPITEDRLLELMHRHIRLHEVSAATRAQSKLQLLVGATDVLSGERLVFGKGVMTDRHLLASAAVPPLFRAVEVGGQLCWDGLFSTNPPIREFTDGLSKDDKPDEIWIIQINPHQAIEEPRQIKDTVDRRNELSGNLALAQELFFIEAINKLVARHPKSALGADYKPIDVKFVELDIPRLDYESKLDRDPAFIESLMKHGRECGARFLDATPESSRGSIPRRNSFRP